MVVGTRHYAEIGRIAEEAGFTSLHVPDHLVYPDQLPPEYPYSDDGVLRLDGVELNTERLACYDPFVQLGFLAAATSSVRLVTGVCIAPLYHPLFLARSLATVDRMSGGRVTLGLGVGWMAEEFAAAGAGFRDRGRRTDSMIGILRELWAGDVINHADEWYEFGPIRFNPKPLNGRAIPIHVGGRSRAALRRAGRLGDGWVEIGSGSIDELAQRLAVVEAERSAAGRAEWPFEVTVTGVPLHSVADYEQIADLGVSRVVVTPSLRADRPRDPDSFREWAQGFRDDVMAKV